MSVIVGLGNPGHTYHGTRHNVGFAVVQAMAERHHVDLAHRLVSPGDARPAAVYGEYELAAGRSVRLVMPLTMMNESGEALRALAVPAAELLIVCDDVNLPLGTIRLRPSGGAGGHHGLQSCLDVLGTESVARLRIGVGMEPLPRDLENFVLSVFASAERPLVARAVEQALDGCDTWVADGLDAAMNRFNRTQQGPKEV